MSETKSIVPTMRIERMILLIRGQKVILDADLAALYGVDTGALNRAVKRNVERFPEDFMFQLSDEEWEFLICQIGISNGAGSKKTVGLKKETAIAAGMADSRVSDLKCQNGASKTGRGGRRHLPYVFTEQGVAMLSSVLHSTRAVAVNIEIMRAFVRLRQWLSSHKDLSRRLDALEAKYDTQFKVVFDAIRELMTPPEKQRRRIGFRADKEEKR